MPYSAHLVLQLILFYIGNLSFNCLELLELYYFVSFPKFGILFLLGHTIILFLHSIHTDAYLPYVREFTSSGWHQSVCKHFS
uniref:Uncharacterized protein MANES_11G096700 n=1 Tax=Rhizophora mucronata TaxID=61149 RepID=A0A2P2LJV0_RHIMU